MPFGKIKNFNVERGFGFVQPDDGGATIFVHVTQIEGGVAPDVGARVMYSVTAGRDGRPAAANVTIIEA